MADNTLIRIHKDRATIEIKKDLSRMEDPYHDYVSVEFAGIDIVVGNFVPYAIHNSKCLFLVINPKVTNKNGLKQYCVVVDTV